MWEEVIEKADNVVTKANLQPPSYAWEIDSKYPKSYCLSFKKDKEDIQQEHHNEISKNKKKAESYNPSTTNQPQIQDSKKRYKSQ